MHFVETMAYFGLTHHFLIAALMCAGAMGLWHAVQFYDHHKLKDEYSYSAWPEVSFHDFSMMYNSLLIIIIFC